MNIDMDVKGLLSGRKFKLLLAGLGIFLVALVSFATGIAVGLHKAKYSYAWGANYERNFSKGFGNTARGDSRTTWSAGMMPGGMMGVRDFDGRNFRNAHGTSGTILSITGNTIIVMDKSGEENTIAVGEKTLIKNGRDTIGISDLKQGDQVIIVGNPGNGGVVNADLIRIFGRTNAVDAVPDTNAANATPTSGMSNN